MPMPDFTNEFLDRFEICNGEIGGIRKVNRVAPLDINPSNSQLPALYTMPDVATTIQRSGAYVQITRDYLITGLVKPIALDRRENALGDSALVMAALDLEYLILDYYFSHPRLHTDGLPDADPPTPPLAEFNRLTPGQDIVVVSSTVMTLDRIVGEEQARRPAYVGTLTRIRTVCQYKVLDG